MIKKITIEKIYLLLIILLLGAWGALNMLLMEKESLVSDESPILKALQGLIFIVVSLYLLVNYKYVHVGKMGWILCVLSIYMAIGRMAVLPVTVGIFSYIYQPMRDITVFLLFLFAGAIVNKSDELRDFFSTWIIVAMLIIAYFYLQNWRFVNVVGEYHMATAYWPMFLLPVLLYSPKRWLRYAGTILVGAVLFASFKRGGILAFGCGLFAYLLVKEVFIGRKFTRLIFFIIALVALAVVFLVVDNAMGNIFSERFMNIKNDGGSDRDVVWATTWRMILDSDFEHLVFGHGFSTVAKFSPLGEDIGAHNDFLESLFDFGVVGTFFYVWLHVLLIKQVVRNIRLHNENAAVMAFCYSFFFVLVMVSFVQIYPWFAFMALSWGMGCASDRKVLSV